MTTLGWSYCSRIISKRGKALSVILPFVACSDQTVVGDHIGLESLLLNQLKELQGSLCNVPPSACANDSVVGDNLAQESLLPPLLKELQGAFFHPTYSACNDESTLGDNNGQESPQPFKSRSSKALSMILPFCMR